MLETKTSSDVEMALELFVEAVLLHPDLELLGTSMNPSDKDSGEVFVIRDLTKQENTEASCIEVSIAEVIKVVSDVDKAKEFIDVFTNDRNAVVLHGITRIVGYYSRVDNWNKSKIGELRDRQQQNYALGAHTPEHEEGRRKAVDNLS